MAYKYSIDGISHEVNEFNPSIHGYDLIDNLKLQSKNCKFPDRLPENLKTLFFEGLRLTEFPNLPTSIEEIFARGNKIHNLPDLSHLPNLIVIDLQDNYVEILENPFPPNITRINLSYNMIETISDDLSQVASLVHLNLSFNKISEIGKFLMETETRISIDHNDLEVKTTIAYSNEEELKEKERALQEKIKQRRQFLNKNNIHQVEFRQTDIGGQPMVNTFNQRQRRIQNDRNIYKDSQNVHDTSIQDSIRKSLDYIMDFNRVPKDKFYFYKLEKCFTKKSFFGIVRQEDRVLSNLREYKASKQTFGHRQVTYTQLLERIWAIASVSPHKKGILKRLKQEAIESKNVCFTGQMSRLVNVLVGFDENVTVGISDGEQLNNQMSQIRKVAEKRFAVDSEEYTKYCLEECKKILDIHNITDEGVRQAYLDAF